MGERAEAANELSDPYRLGTRKIEGGQHPERVDALAGSADPETAALGELLVKRRELREKIEQRNAELQAILDESIENMRSAFGGFLLRDALGPERSTGERMRDAAGAVKQPVGDVLGVQKELYQLGLQGVEHQKKIRSKIREVRAPLTATNGADKDFLVAFRLDPKRRELATMIVKYRGQPLHHVLVLVELDCEYNLERAKEELDGLGGAMLYALGTNLMQLPKEYAERDLARVEYEAMDKGYYAYLDTWNPSLPVEMDVQAALSLVKFTQSVKLTIVSDEVTVVDVECPLAAGKKKLVTDLKAECVRRKKMAMSGRKSPQEPAQKPTKKSAPKSR